MGLAVDYYNDTISTSISVTTGGSNELILVFATSINQPTITDTSGLTWNYRGHVETSFVSPRYHYMYMFWAVASSPLSSDTISTNNGDIVFILGITGANTSSPFDSDSGLPYTGTLVPNSGTSITVDYSTANANDMIISVISWASTAGTVSYDTTDGFTGIANNPDTGGGAQYKLVSAMQSSAPSSFSWTSSVEAGLLVDAIQEGSNIFTESLSDSFSLTDGGITKSISKSESDAFNLIDNGIVKTMDKNESDAFSLSDKGITKVTNKSISNTLSLNDLGINKNTKKSLTDGYILNETLKKSTSKSLGTEGLTIADVSLIKKIGKTFIDSYILAENLTKKINKSISDSYVLTETLTKRTSKYMSDSFSLVDYSLAIASLFTLFLIDSFTLADKGISKITNKKLEDTIKLTDYGITKVTSKELSLDTFGLLEFLSKEVSKTLKDNLTLQEQALLKTVRKGLTDSFNLADKGIHKDITKELSDLFTLTESLSNNIMFTRQLTDSFSLTDLGIVASVILGIYNSVVAYVAGLGYTAMLYDDVKTIDIQRQGNCVVIVPTTIDVRWFGNKLFSDVNMNLEIYTLDKPSSYDIYNSIKQTLTDYYLGKRLSSMTVSYAKVSHWEKAVNLRGIWKATASITLSGLY